MVIRALILIMRYPVLWSTARCNAARRSATLRVALQRTMDNLLGRELSGEEFAHYFGLCASSVGFAWLFVCLFGPVGRSFPLRGRLVEFVRCACSGVLCGDAGCSRTASAVIYIIEFYRLYAIYGYL